MIKSANSLLRTTVVGSYPQPDWLIDKAVLRGQRVPRVRTDHLWRVDLSVRAEALRDATLLAIHQMEEAGIDVITDGESSRESYSNHFAMSLEGLDGSNPAVIVNRMGRETKVHRVVGPIRHRASVELESASLLRANTDHIAKITLPGPFTLAQQCKDEYYKGDLEALANDFALAVNHEARALQETGIDVVQLDEPWLRNDPDAARRFGVSVINKALEGIRVRKALHMCFGYAFLAPHDKPRSYEYLPELADSVLDEISIEAAQPNLDLGVLAELKNQTVALGVLDHSTAEAEPADVVAERIRRALVYLPPDRLMPAPDCGMKYMTRAIAFQRLRSLSEAARKVRKELAGV